MVEKSLAIEAMNADADAFAAGVKSPKKKYRRRRSYAAFLVSTAINRPFSTRMLRAEEEIPYLVSGRDALYADEDLQALAERLLEEAKMRGGEPDVDVRANRIAKAPPERPSLQPVIRRRAAAPKTTETEEAEEAVTL
jgi:hypothetical protein